MTDVSHTLHTNKLVTVSSADLSFFPFVFLHHDLQLSVKGYNDKQHILLRKIIEKMASFEIDEKRFDIIKEAVSTDSIWS